jgi:hypothetical protein
MILLLPFTVAGFEPGLFALQADAMTTAPRSRGQSFKTCSNAAISKNSNLIIHNKEVQPHTFTFFC